jgi:hypothetical protein
MTLAVILLDVLFVFSPVLAAKTPAQTSSQSQATQPDNAAVKTQDSAQPQSAPTQPAQSQSNKPSASATKAAHKPAQKKTPQTKPVQNKKAQPVNCNPVPPAGTSTSGTAKSAPDSPQSGQSPAQSPTVGTAQHPANPASASNCPPQKIVVDQGGTSEPSIQLAGDSNSAPLKGTNQCPNASQCLQSAQQNLQKAAGHQLTSSQHDMVTQIQQFMDQSKKASDSGDLESARTLAWKAQLLSEELVNPEK